MNPPSSAAGPSAPDTGGGTLLLVVFILIGAAVSVALGVYGSLHVPTGHALTTLGFPDLISMKVTLASAAAALGMVQVVTALRMFGRIGRSPARAAVVWVHRLSGITAVLLSAPVAFHCLWSLGFGTYSPRVLAHSLLGCAFYGVFLTKMLTLRSRKVPGWALPWLGGALFAVLTLVWLTSAMWFLTGGTADY